MGRLRRAKRRRAPPAWSVLVAMWRIFAFIQISTGQVDTLAWAPDPPLSAPFCRRAVTLLQANIKSTRHTPLYWHLSSVFVQQPNRTVIKAMEPFGYCARWRPMGRVSSQLSGHREQNLHKALCFRGTFPAGGGRLPSAAKWYWHTDCELRGKGHATVFYVVANAFASPRHDVLHACLQVEFDDRELLERLTYSTSQMQFNGEAVHLGIESGTLPGDITYCRRVVLGCVPQLRDCSVEDAAHVAIRLTCKWMPVITGKLAVGTVCCLDSLHMLMMPAERTSWQTLRSSKTEGALQAPLLLQRCGWATWSRTQRSRR